VGGYNHTQFAEMAAAAQNRRRTQQRRGAAAPSADRGSREPVAFRCPECGEGSFVATTCARCDVALEPTGEVDLPREPTLLSGFEPIENALPFRWQTVITLSGALTGAGSLFALAAANHWGYFPYGLPAVEIGTIAATIGALIALTNPVTKLVRGASIRSRARRLVRVVVAQLRKVPLGRVGDLGEAPAGVVRVRGRVVVLDAIGERDGRPVAAELLGQLARRCGRFAIEDETGTVLVDEDRFVELWFERAGDRQLCEGDLVEVVAPVKRGTAGVSDVSTYRSTGDTPVLARDADIPVHVIVPKDQEGERVPVRVRVAEERVRPAVAEGTEEAVTAAPARPSQARGARSR
jgi:hypothetical protein